MSNKRFKCTRSWARHTAGEIIPEHEYNMLPFEIKNGHHFVEVVSVTSEKLGEIAKTHDIQITNVEFKNPIEPVLDDAEITVAIDSMVDPNNTKSKYNKLRKNGNQ